MMYKILNMTYFHGLQKVLLFYCGKFKLVSMIRQMFSVEHLKVILSSELKPLWPPFPMTNN